MEIVLFICLAICVYTDIKYQKIKNYIVFPMILFGLTYNFCINGFSGFGNALLSTVCVFLIMIPFGVLNGFGMGDVKLFMGVGAIMGTNFCINSLLYSILACLVITVIHSPREFIKGIKRVGFMLKSLYISKKLMDIDSKSSLKTYPYAVFIMAGVVLVMLGGDYLKIV